MDVRSGPRSHFPSPLVGEGGSRGGNPSASRVRGHSLTRVKTPHPPRSRSLSSGRALRGPVGSLGTLSHKGRGEEERPRCTAHAERKNKKPGRAVAGWERQSVRSGEMLATFRLATPQSWANSCGLVARTILAQRTGSCAALMNAKLNPRAYAHCYGWRGRSGAMLMWKSHCHSGARAKRANPESRNTY